jgi:hypothetical protein
MNEDLIDIQELMVLLGYSDERSVKKWCKAKEVPIIVLGLKKYISSQYLTQYIDNQLVIFVGGIESKNTSSETENRYVKKKAKRIKGLYNPGNEIISKYLTKYESNKSQTPKER